MDSSCPTCCCFFLFSFFFGVGVGSGGGLSPWGRSCPARDCHLGWGGGRGPGHRQRGLQEVPTPNIHTACKLQGCPGHSPPCTTSCGRPRGARDGVLWGGWRLEGTCRPTVQRRAQNGHQPGWPDQVEWHPGWRVGYENIRVSLHIGCGDLQQPALTPLVLRAL